MDYNNALQLKLDLVEVTCRNRSRKPKIEFGLYCTCSLGWSLCQRPTNGHHSTVYLTLNSFDVILVCTDTYASRQSFPLTLTKFAFCLAIQKANNEIQNNLRLAFNVSHLPNTFQLSHYRNVLSSLMYLEIYLSYACLGWPTAQSSSGDQWQWAVHMLATSSSQERENQQFFVFCSSQIECSQI
jgi:hypothetical protein